MSLPDKNYNNKKKLKILYVIDGLDTGGAEKLLVNTLRNLDRKIFSPSVFLKCSNAIYKNEFKILKIPLFELHSSKFFDLSAIIKIFKYIKIEKIDIVHTQMFGSDIIGRIASKLANVDLLISTYLNVYALKNNIDLKTRIKTGLDKITAKYFCDKLIAVSKDVQNFHVKSLKLNINKFHVLVPGINLNEFDSNKYFNPEKIKMEMGIDLASYIIIVVGVLSEQKGHKYLIKASSKILKKYPKTHFLILGPGPLKDNLEKLAREEGVFNQYTFTGYTEKLVELLYISDLFISCSLWEGLPQVVIEAMSMRKPVIATKVGGLPELIQDKKNGILIPPKDIPSIINAVIEIRENEELQEKISFMGRKTIESRYDIKVMVNELQKLYINTMENKYG